MKVLVISVLAVWSTLGLGANDVQDFLQKFGQSQSKFKDSVGPRDKVTSPDDRFLHGVLQNFKDGKKFEELNLSPELKSKLLKMANEERNKDPKNKLPAIEDLSLDDVQKIVEKDNEKESPELKDEMKREIAALALLHTEKASGKSTEAAMQTLLRDYLQVTATLTPDREIALPSGWKEKLGLKPEDPNTLSAKKLFALIEEKGVPPIGEKEGLGLLTKLMDETVNNAEEQRIAFQPISRQIFESLKKDAIVNSLANLPKNPAEAQRALDRIQEEIAAAQNAANATFPDTLPGDSRQPSGGGGGRRGHQNSGGNFPSVPQQATPGSFDDAELKACTNFARSLDNANIPLSTGGGECASAPLAASPEAEKEAIAEATGKVRVLFSTALHCLEGLPNLAGSFVKLRIAGKDVFARVLQDINPDGNKGPSVEAGRPDMAVLSLELDAEPAKQLNFTRVPRPEEVSQLAAKSVDSLATVIFQNTKINARKGGNNNAVIGARGRLDLRTNFMRFNSESGLNSSGFLESTKVKSGDSGGNVSTCTFKAGKPELTLLGNVSHVDVLSGDNTGKFGGISSGQSLAHLSALVHGKDGGSTSDKPKIMAATHLAGTQRR